eukprot:13781741-Alexandrium_andersonii.AAC.1
MRSRTASTASLCKGRGGGARLGPDDCGLPRTPDAKASGCERRSMRLSRATTDGTFLGGEAIE